MKRFVLVSLAIVAGASLAATTPAFGGGRDAFRSDLVGSPGSGRTVRSVASGGVPWVVAPDSEVRITEGGRLRADVSGLLITGTGGAADGTTGSVTQVAASLTCTNAASGDAGAPSVVTTAPVPLSPAGNARIDERLALPDPCIAPVVLIRANSATGPWIAASGF